ncbi:MAG: NAD(P)H-quinone oxidoreductase [Alphaproteobacteria bacterium]|nr:NAD(P)H-quinone oxidoreductase [Alphaproteobacteria bacterium]MBF0250339.1 NAD(P)H-quinone oxidoreductase [Alphaproteobacteria bacterium]
MTTPLEMACMLFAPSGKVVEAVRPVPRPAPGEVLIRVQAAGVNRPDLLQRDGLYPPPPGASDIPGLEAAGEIAAVGPGVLDWRVGDAVTALLTGGGYAEYARAPAGQCLPVPHGLDMIEAASLPETFFTVWSNLIGRAGLKPGERVLIHGGTSGIGVAAIQIARLMGARVMATAGSAEKCRVCRELGADLAVNHREQDFVPQARAFGGGVGVDVILDMVGGDYVARDIQALAPDGRLVQIAFLQGSKVEVDLMAVMLKRLTVTGSTLRARSPDFKAAVAAELLRNVWPALETGAVRPIIHGVHALTDAATALGEMERGGHIGKIVLKIA